MEIESGADDGGIGSADQRKHVSGERPAANRPGRGRPYRSHIPQLRSSPGDGAEHRHRVLPSLRAEASGIHQLSHSPSSGRRNDDESLAQSGPCCKTSGHSSGFAPREKGPQSTERFETLSGHLSHIARRSLKKARSDTSTSVFPASTLKSESGTTKRRSRKRLARSQEVSETMAQQWQAAPWRKSSGS